jgi:hypothetical protein
LGTLRPISYGQIAELLNGIAERFYWDKIMEGDNVVGLRQVNYFHINKTLYPFFFFLLKQLPKKMFGFIFCKFD